MGYQLHLRLPDEARSLPPPPLFNFVSFWMALNGWGSVLLYNAIQRRPVLRTSVHRQLFWASAGFYLGHYLTRRAAYYHAKRDRDISEYIRHHPEDFPPKERKRMAEVLEEFYPIR